MSFLSISRPIFTCSSFDSVLLMQIESADPTLRHEVDRAAISFTDAILFENKNVIQRDSIDSVNAKKEKIG